MPRVAILGASGFLGAPIANNLSNNGWEVFGFTRRINSNLPIKQLHVDIFDEDSIKSALSTAKPEFVISTAWDTEHGQFWTKESIITYRDSTLRFAELSFEAGVETFFGLGTMSEYGTSPGFCNAEVSQLVANDIYSKSKIETGLALKEIGEIHGGQTHWARVFQAFGPNEKHERFIPGLIKSLKQGKKFSIRTPNFEMDWIHTLDVASAITFTLENDLNHFVDIGTGVGTTVRELSELICDEFQLDSSLLDYSGQIPGHEKKAVVDQKAQLLARGWKPAASLRNRVRSLS